MGPRIDSWHIDRVNETITRNDLLRVHSADYVNRLYSDQLEKEIIRTFELIDKNGRYYRYNPENARYPLTRLFDRLLLKAAETIQCCREALEKEFCFAFGGGMHHAKRDYGEGFCVVNDIVIALRKLQSEGTSILYISHKLHEIRDLCEAATILRGGRVVATCDPRKETPKSLAEMMIGTSLQQVSREREHTLGDVRFSVNGLSLAGIEVDRKVLADLAVHEPEAFGAIVKQAQDALTA